MVRLSVMDVYRHELNKRIETFCFVDVYGVCFWSVRHTTRRFRPSATTA
jgi:hypothetical protein